MIGQTLNNRYTITSRLGKGVMGMVYRATDTKSGKAVALKIISSELIIDPDMLERFRREGEALSKLKHPNIVGFIDAFQHDENYVIVMEYVSGGSLYELIKVGPLPIEQVRQIALDLCDALIRAHRLSIIHRDLKPENILIDQDGTPKLADFGVARLSEGTRLTRSGTQVGTPYYMSPEAWEGKTLDAQADIWSLGVILFEMLTGQVPFGGDTGPAVMNKVFTSPSPDLKKLRADVSKSLAKIVSRMLTRDKNRRYRTMREVAVDLEREPSAKIDKDGQEESRAISAKKPFNWNSTAALLIFGMAAISIFMAFGFPQWATQLANRPLQVADQTPTTSTSLSLAATNSPAPTLTPTMTATPTRIPSRTPSVTPTPVYVEGEILFEKDFEDKSLNGLRITLGSLLNWTVIDDGNNRVLEADPAENQSVMISSSNRIFDNYVLEFDAKFPHFNRTNPNSVEIWFRNDKVCSSYIAGLGRYLFLGKHGPLCSDFSHLVEAKNWTGRNNTWYSMKIFLFQNQMSVYLDDRLIHTLDNIEYVSGAFAFEVSKDNIVYFDNIRVIELLPR